MIEQLARTSAEDLRARTTGDLDAGLADLHVRQARHVRRTRLGAVAAVVLAVGLGWSAHATLIGRADRGVGPTHPSPRPSASPSYFDYPCQVNRVRCLGHRTYQIGLARPVRWQLPPRFSISFGNGVTPLGVDAYRSGGPTDSGVTVREQVRASSPDGNRAAPGVADDPRAFVDWVASRPFLHAGPVVSTEVDGHPAWQVRATLARGAGPGPARCNGGDRCYSITYVQGPLAWGIWGDMAAQITAFRLPGAGTTVEWSWVFSGHTRDLSLTDAAVHGLSWPGRVT